MEPRHPAISTFGVSSNLPTHFVRHGSTVQRPTSQSTKNRYIATLRTLLNMCEKMQWLGRAPILSNYREPAVRIRFLTLQQARTFITALPQDWMRDICRFALATGMRSAEILMLTWDKVDLKRSTAWVSANASKSGSARVIPLNSEALDVLNAPQRRQRLHAAYRGTCEAGRCARMLARAFAAAGVEFPLP
jgi:integrase